MCNAAIFKPNSTILPFIKKIADKLCPFPSILLDLQGPQGILKINVNHLSYFRCYFQTPASLYSHGRLQDVRISHSISPCSVHVLLHFPLSFSCQLKLVWYLFANSFPYSLIAAAAAASKLLQSCPTLCDPLDSSPPGSAVPGILQARTLEWVAVSFSNA